MSKTKISPLAVRSYKVISLGLGQQSVALYLMSCLGYVQRADYAIFSDPGSESKPTYDYLRWLKKWAKQNNGIPIIHTGKRTLYRDLIHGRDERGNRFFSIPAFTLNPEGQKGMLQRQCTEVYKIFPVNKAIRSIYKLEKRQRTPPTEVWLGITLEEIERMKYPRTRWLTYVYPFLNVRSYKSGHDNVPYTSLFRRSECVNWLKEHGFPVPPKSACIFCPFQSDARWKEMKEQRPREWKRAVRLDEKIRNSTKKGVTHPVFLHRSAKPLKEAELKENQLDMFNAECTGMCGN